MISVMALFVRETVSLADKTMQLSNGLVGYRDELDMLIKIICTC